MKTTRHTSYISQTRSTFFILLLSVSLCSFLFSIGCGGSSSRNTSGSPYPPPTSTPAATSTPLSTPTPAVALSGTRIIEESPVWSPDGRKIAYKTREYRLHIINVDGTNRVTIDPKSPYFEPLQWLPDGSRLLYTVTSTTNGTNSGTDLYSVNADGTNPTNLTHGTVVNSTSYLLSPDGQKIAFNSTRDNPSGDIYTMNTQGSDITRLTQSGQAGAHSPSWLPDGRILYNNASGTFAVKMDGSTQQLAAPTPLLEVLPNSFTRSPSGLKITYNTGADGTSLIVADIDGNNGQKRNGTIGLNDAFGPIDWSHDGTKIVFSGRSDQGKSDVYITDATTGNPIQVTSLGNVIFSPRWSQQDDKQIAFMNVAPLSPNADGTIPYAPRLYLVNADGTNARRLTNEAIYP